MGGHARPVREFFVQLLISTPETCNVEMLLCDLPGSTSQEGKIGSKAIDA
jgi:hypothetical protein